MPLSTDGEFQFGHRWVELASGLSLPDDTVSSLEDRDHNLENYLALHTATVWNDSVAGTGDPRAVSWSPSITQGVAVATTVNVARWRRIGNTVNAVFHITATASGTSGSAVVVELPVEPYDDVLINLGSGTAWVSPNFYGGSWRSTLNYNKEMAMQADQVTTWFGKTPVLQIVSGSWVEGNVTYEVA